MNCREIEEMMPRYLEGDASEEEREAIQRHVASCAECRESLEAFAELEKSLVRLKDTIPSWERAQAVFARRTGFDMKASLARIVWSAPSLAGVGCIASGILLLVRGQLLLSGLRTLSSRLAVSFDSIGASLSRWLSGAGSLDVAVLLTIAVILTLLPLFAFRLAVQRFGRR